MGEHTKWAADNGTVYMKDSQYLVADCRDSANPQAIAEQIATLPDLLKEAEALVILAYEYNAIRGKLVRDVPEDDLYADRIEALEAAIAKAKGGS